MTIGDRFWTGVLLASTKLLLCDGVSFEGVVNVDDVFMIPWVSAESRPFSSPIFIHADTNDCLLY